MATDKPTNDRKPVVYVAGPITGRRCYWEPFEKAEELLTGLGYIVLLPSRLPSGMSKAQYMRIDIAMIDSADAVVFLPEWETSSGAEVEARYCRYIEKPAVFLRDVDQWGARIPDKVSQAWLEHKLEEVLKK